VDVEPIVLAEGSPAVTEIADVQLSWTAVHSLGPGEDPAGQPGQSALPVPADH
jgi:hypothetical protein